LLMFTVISLHTVVECGGGRSATLGEKDTVEDTVDRSSSSSDEFPSIVELLDENGNDYEYKTVVPNSVIIPIVLPSAQSKRGGGRAFKRGGGRPVDILADVIEKRGGARAFPAEKRGGGRVFGDEKRGGGRLFKRGGGRPSVIEPE
ncbi:hypothetical protein PFISCL1PPCAC_10541, partial [Pristionchus fissidentatus]